MEITLNGAPRDVADGLTIAQLLAELNVDPRGLAVERNRELVPRRDHHSAALQPGDRIEVVTLVGGG